MSVCMYVCIGASGCGRGLYCRYVCALVTVEGVDSRQILGIGLIDDLKMVGKWWISF